MRFAEFNLFISPDRTDLLPLIWEALNDYWPNAWSSSDIGDVERPSRDIAWQDVAATGGLFLVPNKDDLPFLEDPERLKRGSIYFSTKKVTVPALNVTILNEKWIFDENVQADPRPAIICLGEVDYIQLIVSTFYNIGDFTPLAQAIGKLGIVLELDVEGWNAEE